MSAIQEAQDACQRARVATLEIVGLHGARLITDEECDAKLDAIERTAHDYRQEIAGMKERTE